MGMEKERRFLRHIQKTERRRALRAPLLWMQDLGPATAASAARSHGLYGFARNAYHRIQRRETSR
jgi:hypothetical protein